MKRKLIVTFMMLILTISLSPALVALSISDLKFENNKLTYNGESLKYIVVTFGSNSFPVEDDAIIEIKRKGKPGITTIISKSLIITIDEEKIKGTVYYSNKSLLEIKL